MSLQVTSNPTLSDDDVLDGFLVRSGDGVQGTHHVVPLYYPTNTHELVVHPLAGPQRYKELGAAAVGSTVSEPHDAAVREAEVHREGLVGQGLSGGSDRVASRSINHISTL